MRLRAILKAAISASLLAERTTFSDMTVMPKCKHSQKLLLSRRFFVQISNRGFCASQTGKKKKITGQNDGFVESDQDLPGVWAERVGACPQSLHSDHEKSRNAALATDVFVIKSIFNHEST